MKHLKLTIPALLTLAVSILLTACGGPVGGGGSAQPTAFSGTAYGGRQPISGSSVVVYGAGINAGDAPTELGATTTDSSGTFNVSITPPTGQIVYVVITGGNAGNGSSNPAIKLMTIAGAYCTSGSAGCSFPSIVNINELTTVASTAVLQDYINFVPCNSTNITGNTQTGTCVSVPGANDMAKMAGTVGNLVNIVSGQAGDFLTSNTGIASLQTTQQKLNTLADILAACVNSSGNTSSACTNLFKAAINNPSDTLKATDLIAASPVINAKGTALFALLPTPAIFTPVLAAAPSDWTVGGQRYAYTANQSDSTVSSFRLGVINGSLDNDVPGSPFATGSGPASVTVDPSGHYAYVANRYDNTVSAYTLGSDGTLSANGPVVATGASPVSVTVDPSGRYAYVANYSDGSVSAYTIGSDGTLSANGPVVATGSGPISVTVDPSGRYVYVRTKTTTASRPTPSAMMAHSAPMARRWPRAAPRSR